MSVTGADIAYPSWSKYRTDNIGPAPQLPGGASAQSNAGAD
jgi:hypothetical protein